MATYNGERFLGEQIDSLLQQTYKDWHLYVHDDGSNDDTIAIVKKYIHFHPNKITLLDYPPQGGPCRNFLSMLEKVEAPYYMFCDQDDVWLKEKIELSIQEMKRQETKDTLQPIVIHTDLYIADEQLSVTFDSLWAFTGKHPQYIRTFDDAGGHTSIATGCTMLFNHQAKESCNVSSDKAIMHDCWLCLCTLKRGGIVQAINEKTVLYRQHGSNALGSGKTNAADVGIKFRLKHFNEVYKSNRNYYVMLQSLGYGTIFKYIYSKVKFKKRMRRGFY